ncbi:MAG TPA: hypothetical protein VIL78_13640 [Hanamia sp.]
MSTGIDIQFVRENYQKMTDEELIRISTKDFTDLTQEAQEVVIEELKKRNLNTNASNVSDEIQINNQQTFAEVNSSKSFEFALLFAFLFGPFGLLYVSITYGIVMIVLALVGFLTLSYAGLILIWILSVIFAINATRNSKNIISTTTKSNSDDRQILLNQLSQLHSLKEKNVITDEIYEQERHKILALFDKQN